jgi:hypothetical protein
VTRRDVTSALFTLTLLAGAGIEVFVAAKLLQTAELSFYLDCVFHYLAFAVKLLGLRGLCLGTFLVNGTDGLLGELFVEARRAMRSVSSGAADGIP